MNELLLVFLVIAHASAYTQFRTLRLVKPMRLLAGKSDGPSEKPKLSIGNVIQLILMGAGAPALGEYKGTDDNGKMMFELEANNLDLQRTARCFNDGWVEGEDSEIPPPPGFFENLLSGGKLQEQWDASYRKYK